MKKQAVICWLLSLALTLCACGQTGTGAVSGGDTMTEVWRSVAWFDLPLVAVEHGEDYVIRWEDPGMEAHVRLWLDRPEGEIRTATCGIYRQLAFSRTMALLMISLWKNLPRMENRLQWNPYL